MLARGRRLHALACDDAHFDFDDAFGAWVMVQAEAREPEALVAALKAGHYYSSTGPEIHALSPHPGAWTLAAGERLRILRARPCAGAGEPGRALGGLRVACGQGAIEILEAQREGRRAMGAEELARGFALPDILG